MIATRFYRQQLRIVETRMNGPFTQTNGQLAQKFRVAIGFSDRVKKVTVQKVIIVGGQPLALHFFDPGSSGNPQRQSVFSCQLQHQLQNIRSTADAQRMPIQMSRLQPGCQHDFDLRPEFHFQLI